MDIQFDKLIEILEYLDRIEPYFVFIIVLIGIIGNVLSFGVFIFTKFK